MSPPYRIEAHQSASICINHHQFASNRKNLHFGSIYFTHFYPLFTKMGEPTPDIRFFDLHQNTFLHQSYMSTSAICMDIASFKPQTCISIYSWNILINIMPNYSINCIRIQYPSMTCFGRIKKRQLLKGPFSKYMNVLHKSCCT